MKGPNLNSTFNVLSIVKISVMPRSGSIPNMLPYVLLFISA